MPSIRASCSPAPPRRRLPPPTGRPSPRQPPEETTDGAPAAGAQSWRPLPHTGRRRRRGEERELRSRQGRNHGAGRRERLRQERKSGVEGRSGSVRVDLGGGRKIKK